MDSTILAAIIGSISVLICTALPIYLPRRRKRRDAEVTYARELNNKLAKQYEARISAQDAIIVSRDRRIGELEALLDGKRRSRESTNGG